MNIQRMILHRSALVCIALLANSCLMLSAAERARPAAAASNPAADTARGRYDIEVENGGLLLAHLKDRVNLRELWGPGDISGAEASMGNLVKLLRALHPDANIVLAPGVEKLRIADLKLRATGLSEVLEALRVASDYRFTWSTGAGMGGFDPMTGMVQSPPASSNTMLHVLSLVPSPEGERNLEVFNLQAYLGSLEGDPLAASVKRLEHLILEALKALRPRSRGEQPTFQFHSGASLLVVIGDPLVLETARKVVDALQAQPSVEGTYAPGFPPYGGAYPVPRRDSQPVSKERKAIHAKLETIRLDTVQYDGLPLGAVVRGLQDEIRRRDPENRGINFLIDPNQPSAAPASGSGGGAIDPFSGRPIASPRPPEEPVDITAVQIRIMPALSNVRLVDVLDAIVKVAEIPIRYSITDYAVVFSLRGDEAPTQERRVMF